MRSHKRDDRLGEIQVDGLSADYSLFYVSSVPIPIGQKVSVTVQENDRRPGERMAGDVFPLMELPESPQLCRNCLQAHRFRQDVALANAAD